MWRGVACHLLALDTGGVGGLPRGVVRRGIARTVQRLSGGVARTGTSSGRVTWTRTCRSRRVAGRAGRVTSWRVDGTGTVARVARGVLGPGRGVPRAVGGRVSGCGGARTVCRSVPRRDIARAVVGSVAGGLRVGGGVAGGVSGSEARHVRSVRGSGVGRVSPRSGPVVEGRGWAGVQRGGKLCGSPRVSRGVARRDLSIERSKAWVVAVWGDVYAVGGGVGGDVAGGEDLGEYL